MQFPTRRMRRLRKTPQIRKILRETTLNVEDFIYPLFIKEDLELISEPVERELVERLVVREAPRDERAEEFDCVSAPRSLSKSLSACLLVREALRRSAPSAAVTSL